MRERKDRSIGVGVGDTNMSYAFVTVLDAAYGGMWAFERSLRSLDRSLDREDELARAEKALERLQSWRRGLPEGRVLFSLEERPVLDVDASSAWRLLHVAEGRLRSLINELIASSDLDTLRRDEVARNIRVAAMVECARAEELQVLGMVDWMAATGQEEAADAWRQRLLACTVRVEEADRWLATFRELRDEPEANLLEQFLDDTLLLAADVAERVVDICHTCSLYTGLFDYADVGVAEDQVEAWFAGGFSVHDAGRWFAAGHSPDSATEWIAVGAVDPMVAAGFMWRGFAPAEARPWLNRHIGGRMASAWARSGHDPEDAREWIALGVPEPHILASLPALETRVM